MSEPIPDTPEAPPKPRRWLAVLLSLVSPGLGHAYAGEFARAFLISLVIAFAIQPLLALYSRTATLFALIVVVVTQLTLCWGVVAFDAARVSQGPRKRFFTRSAVFLSCIGFLVVSAAIDGAGKWLRDHWIAEPFRIPSETMLPTLRVGDHVFADPRAYADRDPARGDIVAFRVARDRDRVLPLDQNPERFADTFVKRIVGLPGDEIEIDGATLVVNGEPKTGAPSSEQVFAPRNVALALRPEALGTASYVVADDPRHNRNRSKTTFVEPDRYFLAGDNRDHSDDSRNWGTVHRDDIVGRATKVYWSWEFNGPWSQLLNPSLWPTLLRQDTRWDRIGTELE